MIQSDLGLSFTRNSIGTETGLGFLESQRGENIGQTKVVSKCPLCWITVIEQKQQISYVLTVCVCRQCSLWEGGKSQKHLCVCNSDQRQEQSAVWLAKQVSVALSVAQSLQLQRCQMCPVDFALLVTAEKFLLASLKEKAKAGERHCWRD